MCTAINLSGNHHFFGRNLDLDRDYDVSSLTTPSGFDLNLRHVGTVKGKYSILGAGLSFDNFPLYFDAMNDQGLCAAGLNFPGCAKYGKQSNGSNSLCSFELIPFILGCAANSHEAAAMLKSISITDDSFNDEMPSTPLHWIFGDKHGTVIAEPLTYGLNITYSQTGVLSNSPDYSKQLQNLSDFGSLSEKSVISYRAESKNTVSVSLPGGMTSRDRFIRASYFVKNRIPGSYDEEMRDIFTFLESAAVPKGSVITDDGSYHYTRFTSCCDTENGAYYFKKYPLLSHSKVSFESSDNHCGKLILTRFC